MTTAPTNTVAGFDNETCVFTEDQGLVCTPTAGSGVTLNFTWTNVPGSTFASTGTQTFSGKGFTFVFHGTRISTSATFAALALVTLFGNRVMRHCRPIRKNSYCCERIAVVLQDSVASLHLIVVALSPLAFPPVG
jgi:hypothetical protein